MIELPKSTAIIRTPPEESDEPDASLISGDEKGPVEHELLIVKSKPLTAKFRTIIQHLAQRAGRFSRFRGLHIFLGYTFLFHLLSSVLMKILPKDLPVRSFIHVLVSVGLCRLSLLWTHVVISEPSKESWYRRIVSRAVGSKVIIPTAMFALAEQAAVLLPTMLAKSANLQGVFRDPNHAFNHMSQGEQSWTLLKLALISLSGVVCFITIYLPAKIAFTRVQASLLSSEDEAIVPFDRSFGGKVVPAVMGAYGKIVMGEAWKTFDWNSRIRVFKVYAKVALIQGAIFVIYAFTMLFEFRFAMGSRKFDEKVMALLQQPST